MHKCIFLIFSKLKEKCYNDHILVTFKHLQQEWQPDFTNT